MIGIKKKTLLSFLVILLIFLSIDSIIYVPIRTAEIVVIFSLSSLLIIIGDFIKNKIIDLCLIIYSFITIGYIGIMYNSPLVLTIILLLYGIYFITLRVEIYPMAVVYLGLLCFILTLALFFLRYAPSKLQVAALIVIILMSVEELSIKQNIMKCRSESMLIIFLAIGFLAYIAPAKSIPYEWKGIKSIYNKLSNLSTAIAGGFSDNIELPVYIGYSEIVDTYDGTLMDSNTLDLVISSKATRMPVYLRGNVYTRFDGQKWQPGTLNSDLQTDLITSLYAIYSLCDDKASIKNFLGVYTQKIEYANLKTDTIFFPNKTVSITKNNKNYEYTFVEFKYSNKELKRIIANSHTIHYNSTTYKEMCDFFAGNFGIVIDSTFAEFTKNVSKAKDSAYKGASQHLSDRAKSKADEITKGCTKDFDICKSLVNYTSTFKYNTNIDSKKGTNIIDWFMFESKSGYCVHYSTVLTELLRYKGIYARLVSGYKTDNSGEVLSSMAHTWVEAYIDGFGWITLEPINSFPGDITYIEPENTETNETDTPPKDNTLNITWIYYTAATLFIILLITITIILIKIIKRAKSRDVKIILNDIIRILEKEYLAKKPCNTYTEYINGLSLSKDLSNQLLKVISIIEAGWYGDYSFTDEDIDFARQIRKEVKRFVKEM